MNLKLGEGKVLIGVDVKPQPMLYFEKLSKALPVGTWLDIKPIKSADVKITFDSVKSIDLLMDQLQNLRLALKQKECDDAKINI